MQSKLELLPLHKLGATTDKQNPGAVNFGFFLPGVSAEDGNKFWVKVIHEKDQFLQGILPMKFEMEHSEDLEYGDYWSATINIESRDKLKPYSAWGNKGKYVYRYHLENQKKQDSIDWVIDPFAREFGIGKLSAFTLGDQDYEWDTNELAWKTPSINDIILYELMINEFANDIKGTIDSLGYLADLGINCIEMMPLSNVEKRVDWGYMPIGYFGVDERFGNRKDIQKLIDAAPRKTLQL